MVVGVMVTHSLLPASVVALVGRCPPSNTMTGVMSYLRSMFTFFIQYLMNGLHTIRLINHYKTACHAPFIRGVCLYNTWVYIALTEFPASQSS